MLPEKTMDVHAHFLPPVYREALRSAGLTLLDGGMPIPDWSPEQALDMMDQLGVRAAVLSVSSPFAAFAGTGMVSLCRAINDEAARLREAHPDRFGAYAILPVPDVEASLAELERALDVLALDGVALPTHADGQYLGDPRLNRLMDALDERGASVFVHPTSPCCFERFGLGLPAPMIEFPFDTTRAITSLLFCGQMARRRRIRFIFSHGGGALPILAQRIVRMGGSPLLGDRAVPAQDSLATLAGFHYDLALAGTPEQVAALRSLVPASQILYGTDFPFAPGIAIAMAAASFETLPFDEAERNAIAFDNAALLFPAVATRCCGHHG